MQQEAIPATVRSVTDTLANAGYQAYLVGGCVRDILIGKAPKDWDATTNATPEQIQALFEETFYENEFGTVGVVTGSEDPALKVVEVTPYRLEGEYSDARRPDTVAWGESIEDDLRRRDFTINAIAFDPQTGAYADPHGGREDLARKVIVTVGDPHDRFSEDALRMLRAVRLSAELDFAIAPETAAGIAAQAGQLAKISRERVRDELTRILMSPRPMQALYMAQKLGLLPYIIPELEEGIGCDQNQAHSFDVFEHLLRSLQHAADKGWPLEVRLAALLHDIGKPASRRWSDEKKDWTFYGHEVIGARMAKKILNDLRYPKETIDNVVSLIRWHMFFSDPDEVTLSAVRRIIRNVGQEHIWELMDLRICDRIGTGRPKEQPFRLRKYQSMIDEALRDPISVGMLKIDGARLMAISKIAPGPRIGWTLHALLEEVLDDPSKNTEAYMETRALELLALPDEELQKLGEAGKERRDEEDAAAVMELREKRHVN
ncbi:MAG TPA: HD domain-containing protein [Candidatus Paceibacterota bacterium]|nr:HD domain-containing protein [Candidatus Paceibacterota bacterium]